MGGKTTEISDLKDSPAGYDIYEVFAEIYDEIMAHVPYERWAGYLVKRVTAFLGNRPGSVVDLACGTGVLADFLQRKISDVYGMDASPAMLRKAERLLPGRVFTGRLEERFPFDRNQFDWVVCTHDSLNYLITDEQLEDHFREVARILKKGGIYSVDAVTRGNILRNFDGQRSVHDVGGWTLVWENSFSERSEIMDTVLTFIDKDSKVFVEKHRQRYLSEKRIMNAAGFGGLRLIAKEGNYTLSNPAPSNSVINYHFKKYS